jgi:hypothetical protein
MRWVTPLAFAIATVAVRQYNGTHAASQLIFPGVWLVPGAEHDISAQGQWTWRLFGFATLIFMLWAAWDQVAAWRRRDEAQRAAEEGPPKR